MTHKVIREWGRVTVGPGRDFSREEANALLDAARAHPLGGDEGLAILSDHSDHLRAKQMVGVIAAPGCSLEILPKVASDAPDEAEPDLRQRLLGMLDIAYGIDAGLGNAAPMARQDQTLLDIFIRAFADRLLNEARRGLPRAYLPQEEDLRALRGRLDVVRQFTVHAVRPDRLACRFDELSPDTPLLQAMKACAVFLRKFARSISTQRPLDEVRFLLADVSNVAPRDLPWKNIRIDRMNRRWEALLQLAKLFLMREWQATHYDAARAEGLTILFPMNDLFEAYVAALAARAVRGTGLTVQSQGGNEPCLLQNNIGRFRTKPDLLVRNAGGQIVEVLDTKWKRLNPVIDDPKQGVSQGDIYQVMAYGRLYQCNCLILIYPHHPALGPAPFRQTFFINKPPVQANPDTLTFITLDVTQPAVNVQNAIAALLAQYP